MNLILIAGIPGSGKTTVSQMLSNTLSIPCLSKDDVKLQLYETYGFQSFEEKKKLDALAERQLYAKIKESIVTGDDLIVDKWYPETDAILDGIKKEQVNIICIHLLVSAEVASKRYNARNREGSRPIALRVLNQFPVIEGVSVYEEPKSIEDMMLRIQETPDIKKTHAKLEIKNDDADLARVYRSVLNFVKHNLKHDF